MRVPDGVGSQPSLRPTLLRDLVCGLKSIGHHRSSPMRRCRFLSWGTHTKRGTSSVHGIKFPKLASLNSSFNWSDSSCSRIESLTDQRPACLRITQPGRPHRYVIFLTITPGGGGLYVRPPTERRIQLTNVGGLTPWGLVETDHTWRLESGIRRLRLLGRTPPCNVFAKVPELASKCQDSRRRGNDWDRPRRSAHHEKGSRWS